MESTETREWICPQCEVRNHGTTCIICGAPKPAVITPTPDIPVWKCPKCGVDTYGNRCLNCNTDNPDTAPLKKYTGSRGGCDITFGWILLILQIAAGSPDFLSGFVAFLGYYLPGILGICLLICGYSKRSKIKSFDEEVDAKNVERARKREIIEEAMKAVPPEGETISSVSHSCGISMSRGNREKY